MKLIPFKKAMGLILLGMVLGNCARQNDALTPLQQEQARGAVNLLRILQEINLRVLSSVQQPNGSWVTTINATSFDNWAYFNFLTRADGTQDRWDLAVRRFTFATRSGLTAPGSGGSCRANSTDFASAITQTATALGCPVSAIEIDRSITQQTVGGVSTTFVGSPALTNWFSYTIGFLTPTKNVYVIRSGDGTKYYVMQMLDYYSEAGTSGYPKFQWKEISL